MPKSVLAKRVAAKAKAVRSYTKAKAGYSISSTTYKKAVAKKNAAIKRANKIGR